MLRNDLSSFPEYKVGKDFPNALKLSSNEVPFPPAEDIIAAVADAARTTNRYQHPGSLELTNALCNYLGVPADNIFVSAGSTPILQATILASCHTGDEVIVPWRSFEAYPLYVRMAGAEPILIPLTEDYRVDLEAVLGALTEKTKLIILCNPNNPTGTVITRSEFRAFMNRVPKDVVVLLDEAYWEYNDAPDTPDSVEEYQRYPNLLGVRTFSKAWGLAGMRVGYAVAGDEIINALRLLSLPLTVTAMAETAAVEVLKRHDELADAVEITKAQRDRVCAELGAEKSYGNFVWLPRADAAEVETKMLDEGVVIRRYLDEGVRVSITDEAESTQFLEAWRRAGIEPWRG